MKLLLDECTPKVLKVDFVGHQVFTVEDAGFKGLKNGKLSAAAAADGFEALVTVDKALSSQQNLTAFGLAVLVLRAKSNRYDDLKLLVPKALAALSRIQPGTALTIKL